MQEGNGVASGGTYGVVSREDFVKVTDAVGVEVYNFLLTDDHYQLHHVTSERHIFTLILQERGKRLSTKGNNGPVVLFGDPVQTGAYLSVRFSAKKDKC